VQKYVQANVGKGGGGFIISENPMKVSYERRENAARESL
jgi:hypothetical protein